MTLETLIPTLFFFVYRMSTSFSPYAPVLLLRPSPSSPFFPRLLFFCPSTHSPFPPSGKGKFHQHLLLKNNFTFYSQSRGKERGNNDCCLVNFTPCYSLCGDGKEMMVLGEGKLLVVGRRSEKKFPPPSPELQVMRR